MFHRPKTETNTAEDKSESQSNTKQTVSESGLDKKTDFNQNTINKTVATAENAVREDAPKEMVQKTEANVVSEPQKDVSPVDNNSEQSASADNVSEANTQTTDKTSTQSSVSSQRPFRREDMDAPIKSFIKSRPVFTKAEENKTMSSDQSNTAQDQATPTHNPFTRPAQNAATARTQQKYTATPYAAPQSDASSNDRRLVIGSGITMSGEIEACDYLVIEGTVEAALKGARVLDVTETGTFYGAVEIEEATIAGRFEGDIIVNGRLTIKDTGSVTGVISYRELQVEAGATIDGRITPIVAKAEKRAGEQQQAPTKKVPPRNDNDTDVDSSGELPFAGNVAAAE